MLIRITDHFSTFLTIVELGILGVALEFITNHRPFGEMTDADKVMSPQQFGSDKDIQVRIWNNPEIRIRIRGHFWLTFWSWRRFVPYEQSLVDIVTDSRP